MSVVSISLSSYFRKKVECVSIHTKYNNLKLYQICILCLQVVHSRGKKFTINSRFICLKPSCQSPRNMDTRTHIRQTGPG